MENQTYVSILVTTLQKKLSLLEKLNELTERQKTFIEQEKIEEDGFEQIFDEKDAGIEALNKLDDGFEAIYERVREELENHAPLYKKEIIELQGLISKITDGTVKLQALEQRNFKGIEAYLTRSRTKIKSFHQSNRTAANYYQNMTKQEPGQSYFLDKKK